MNGLEEILLYILFIIVGLQSLVIQRTQKEIRELRDFVRKYISEIKEKD